MAGNTGNAGTWPNADVLIGSLTAVNPVGGAAHGVDWKFAGLLDGGQGFEEGRESDSTDHFAWGGILVDQTDKNYKQTFTFTALEDNPVVRALVNPGSTFTAGASDAEYSGVEVVPTKEKFKLSFQTQKGAKISRKTTKNYAQLEGWPTRTKTEDDLDAVKITVAVYPSFNAATGKYELFDVFVGPKATA